jgi:hypothetical protein
LVHLEGFVNDICDFSYPFALDVYLLVVLLDRFQAWSVQEAEADLGFFIVEKVHMGDSEFVRGRLAKLPEIVFSKWHLVDI